MSRHSRFVRLPLLMSWVLLAPMLASGLADQPAVGPAPKDASSATLRFRRVYVPADQIDQLPRHGVRYVPMDAAEFERAAANLSSVRQPSAPASMQPPNVEVTRAVYEARLTGEVLTDGKATLEIRDAEKDPALLRFDSCRLPVETPRWIGRPSKKGTGTERRPETQGQADISLGASPLPQPATIGVGPDEKLLLRVERSGTLQFDWSLVGRRETGAALVFDLGLPPAPSNELRLALPPDLVPSVEQGFVTLVAAEKGSGNDSPRHWDIELGGQTQIVLRLGRQDFLREIRPLTLVRESMVYDFSPRGMQLSADLKLDVLGEPIQRIGLLLDQPLALVTARYGGTQLPWYETDPAGKKIAGSDSTGHGSTGQSGHSGTRRVVVELPEPLHGTGRVLRLGFVAPPFARGRLPTVRPTGDGLFWQEGSASLFVPLPLALDELTLHGCRQTKAEPLPAPAVGDAIAIQYFRPDADVEIGLARGGERLQVQCGTSIDVRGGTMTGRCRADISAEDGECFKLSADVSPSWIIDSVETVPADSLADWSYTPGNGPAAHLDITLAKSIRPDRPLRLLVGGRWRRSPRGEKLRAGDLEMVTLRGATATRCVSAVHSAAPFRLQTDGGQELLRLDPARLSAIDAALLGGGPIADGTLVFVDNEAARDLTVTLANEMPRYSGAVHLDAQVSDTTLVEAYRIACQPESAELDRLLVHFTRRRDEPIRWNLVTPDSEGAAENAFSNAAPLTGAVVGGSVVAGSADLQDQLSARRLSADQQSALGLAAGGEVWELTFRRPGNAKLEIQAIRSSTLTADTPLSLAQLVQASEQQGSVAIWATGRRIPQINNRRLKPVPIDPAASDSPSRTSADQSPRSATELTAYQYDPVEEIISAAVDPAPSITVSPGTDRPAAWAWSCRLDSYFSPDGSSQHLACWRIENTGRTRVRFQMPAGATFHSAWIDDVLCPASTVTADATSADAMSIDPTASAGDRANLALPNAAINAGIKFELPAGRRFVRVVLQWGSDDGPLSLLASRTSQLPEIDMPVMKWQWHVWLPPRFRLSNPDADSQSSLTPPDSWRQRLFGPFGKPVGEAAFNPLHGDNWVAMVRRLTSDDPAWTQAQRMVERMTQRGTSRSAVAWGALLADTQSDAARPDAARPDVASPSGVLLLVDARALADIGLSPQSPVHPPPPDAARGWPLAQADLVLMVAPRAVVLTTHSAASVWLGPWTTDGSVLQRAPPGPFDEELQLALAGNSERFVPAELWNFPTGKSPWAAATLAGDAPAIDHAGWTVYDLDLSESPRQIGIVDRDRMLVVGSGLFLLCVLLVFAKGDVSWKHQAIAMMVATALALLLPSSCAPLGAGLWLGLAAGWTLRWLARWDQPLGAYSRRLLAAAAGSGTTAAVAAASPANGPTGESCDATSLSVPTNPSATAAYGDSQRRERTSSVRKRNGPGGPMLGLLLVLGCWMWHDAGAAEPAASVPAEHAKPQASSAAAQDVEPIQDVWIPSDDQQHLKGSVYLLPEELYRALVPRGGRSPANAPRNWLITAATYRGGLTRQEKTATLDTTDWKATYDLDVLSPGAHVWIPLGDSDANRSPVNLLPDGVRVDGQAVLFQWEARGQGEETGNGAVGASAGKPAASAQRGVGFDVGATGHHQVELAFRPSPQEGAGATTLDFAILPLATSRLELSMPADVPVEAPGARGRPSFDRARGRLTEWLGPIDRLTVRGWSDPAGGEVKPPVVDVDELYWLKVRPGSVVLEAKFNVRVAEGRLTQLRLLEDPRLRRLPLEAGSPISEVRTEEGDLHTVFVGLAQPVVDRTTFKLSFLLTDTSGIGDLRLPKLEVVGARSENRRLAVSVESPLEFDPPSVAPAVTASGAGAASSGESLTAAQFLSAWGVADAKPQLAYSLPPGDVTWNLPIHSRQPQLESREQLAIAIERGRLRETWLADLTVLGGTVFQIQLPAPPEWIVEQALFRQEGLPDQSIRCARAPGGALTLFLPGPAPEHSKLLLRGSMPYTLGAATSLSELHIIGPAPAKVTSQSILLLRGADVQIAVADAAGMQQLPKGALQSAVEAALSDGLLDRGAMGHLRPADCLLGLSAPGANPAVRIAANSPRVDGKEMTTVRRVNDAWNATVDLDLQVSGGVLDGLRFDLPSQWSEPAEITPAVPSQLIDVPGENRRQLILWPAEAWTGAVRIHLSGPIVTPVGQRMRVPNVRPLGIAQLHRYVLLPTRSGEQNLSWEASGLNFEPLPKKFSPESPPIDVYRTCEVVAEHFEATLKSVDKTIGQPRVRLADIAVACSGDGHCHGAATFALDPAGALNCLLELAPNEHLIHVRSDGVAAAARPVGENHWSVALGDGKLPQQIEVVFTADLPDEPARGAPLLLSAPVLVDLPVEQTLWSVVAASGDASTGVGMAVAGAAPTTEIRQALIRQETISKLLDAASRASAAGPDDPIANWFAAWRHRLLLARGAVDRSRVRDGSSESGHVVDNADALAGATADDAFDLWKQTDGAARPVAGYYVHGFGPTLVLTLPDWAFGGAGWRLIAAILGATVAGLLFWLGGWTSERASRLPGPWFGTVTRPALLGAAAGLFWWLAMVPSWLGLLVIAASVVMLLRFRRLPAKTPVSADS